MRYVLSVLALMTFAPGPAFAGDQPQNTPSLVDKPAPGGKDAAGGFQGITIEQQKAITAAAIKKWEAMTPDQKKDAIDQAKKTYEAIPSETKDKLKAAALKKYQEMSPEEQKKLQAQLSNLINGQPSVAGKP